ncbi:hypothetical protein AOLI_G00293970 [Acnodon oligacanthus]
MDALRNSRHPAAFMVSAAYLNECGRIKKASLFGKGCSFHVMGVDKVPSPLMITMSEQCLPWCPMADPQQFFTGKLYVLVYQLKLPAEELLWLALSWHSSCSGQDGI